MEKTVDKDYENIKLYSIKEIFYNESLRWLRDNNINTIGELMNADYIFLGLVIGDTRIYNNIQTAYKLFRCKYLGIDPDMEIIDDYKIEDIGFWLDFKTNSMNALLASEITADELKNIIKNNDELSAYKELLKIKRLGPTSAKEILFKMSIVLNYYSKEESLDEQKNDFRLDNIGIGYVSSFIDLRNNYNQVKETILGVDKRIDAIGKKKESGEVIDYHEYVELLKIRYILDMIESKEIALLEEMKNVIIGIEPMYKDHIDWIFPKRIEISHLLRSIAPRIFRVFGKPNEEDTDGNNPYVKK